MNPVSGAIRTQDDRQAPRLGIDFEAATTPEICPGWRMQHQHSSIRMECIQRMRDRGPSLCLIAQ
jgi:hypothetical protein